MTVWGRAGQRLTEAEIAQRARRRASVIRISDTDLKSVEPDWRSGRVVPWRITFALDTRNLYGPEVDIACGTEEPAVDEWESGKRYPTLDQLGALAQLTGFPLRFFTVRGPAPDVRDTTLIHHLPPRELARLKPAIAAFTDEAIENCSGTDTYNETHLF